jgi:hypothetical protein
MYYDCDGRFKIGAGKSGWPDEYDRKIVGVLRDEFRAEIASGQATVETSHYVPFGP